MLAVKLPALSLIVVSGVLPIATSSYLMIIRELDEKLVPVITTGVLEGPETGFRAILAAT
jgi:hypothetical protein